MSLGLALPAFSAGAATPAASTAAQQANPFFAESPLPLHFPQFDKIKDSDFAPAFDAGMAQQLKEVEAIANNKAKPTFDNTIVAMERSGQLLNRVSTTFSNLVGTNTNPTLDALDKDRDFLKAGGVMSDDFIDAYIALKMQEVTKFRAATHPLEYQLYYAN